MKELHILNKEYFGRRYRFLQVDPNLKLDLAYLKSNEIDSISISCEGSDKNIRDLSNIRHFKDLRGLGLNFYHYKDLKDISFFENLEYLNLTGKTSNIIPFDALKILWCVYLNYDKKTCESIFECENLEYIFIDNFTGATAHIFKIFKKAKRIGLIKNKIADFDAIQYMPDLEHLGIGYNSNMKSLEWMRGNTSLKSVAFQNCKNIEDWETLGETNTIEKIMIENCGEIPSLSFLQKLTNIKEIRIIGKTVIKDGKIKDLLRIPELNYLFVPVKKEYDVTLQELTAFNNGY